MSGYYAVYRGSKEPAYYIKKDQKYSIRIFESDGKSFLFYHPELDMDGYTSIKNSPHLNGGSWNIGKFNNPQKGEYHETNNHTSITDPSLIGVRLDGKRENAGDHNQEPA